MSGQIQNVFWMLFFLKMFRLKKLFMLLVGLKLITFFRKSHSLTTVSLHLSELTPNRMRLKTPGTVKEKGRPLQM